MQRMLWLIVPVVMSGCMWERAHEHDHEYDSSWEYDTSLEVEARHDAQRVGGAGACAPRSDAEAVASESERAADTGTDTGTHPNETRCASNSDCQTASYCEQDSGECLPGVACEDESSCEPGFNCDPALSLCTPTDRELCSELTDEATCADRDDCMSTYAGIDCTCGPDCTCMGGEPNCVCERFEFHTCEDVEAAANQ